MLPSTQITEHTDTVQTNTNIIVAGSLIPSQMPTAPSSPHSDSEDEEEETRSKQFGFPENKKKRHNYASVDCAASIVATNPEAKNAGHILSNSKDKYMLNICEAKKYVVVELCEEILVDTIVLANNEFFSSTFKDVKVYVPSKDLGAGSQEWTLLAIFRGNNTREPQVFISLSNIVEDDDFDCSLNPGIPSDQLHHLDKACQD
jgi:hypothetical protein